MPRKLKPGKACPECREPMVVITQDTLHRIMELYPVIHSIGVFQDSCRVNLF